MKNSRVWGVLWVIPVMVGMIGAGVFAAEPVLKLELAPGNAMELLRVEPGSFSMGSSAGEAGRGLDENLRTVRLTQAYYLGKTEVTVGQFEIFVRATGYRTQAEDGKSGGYGWNGKALEQSPRYTWRNPGYEQTSEHPVTLLTWPDAKRFCQWLTVKSGRVVQLPTEAQWEYACRAGETGSWSGGAAEEVGWSLSNAVYRAHPVGQKRANAWGFHDMHGNVWEWCEDWYAPYTLEPGPDPVQTSGNLSDKPRRVLRGGSWLKEVKMTRSAARYRNDPLSRNPDNGFRIMVMAVDPAASISVPGPAPGVVGNGVGDGRIRIQPEAGGNRVREGAVERGGVPEGPVHGGGPVPVTPSTGGRLWMVWLIFAVMGAVLVVLVRGLVGALRGTGRGRVSSVGDNVGPGGGGGSKRVPLFQVRSMQDGFWVQAAVAMGTRLGWKCKVGEAWHEGELEYLAGPQGQFVYTALPPSDISIRTVGMGGERGAEGSGGTDITRMPPEDWARAAGMWTVMTDRENRERERDRESRVPPPMRDPSAY